MKKLFAAIFLLSLISCGPSTEVIKSWREPTATINADGSYKTLVIAMVKDEAARRTIEDNFVKRLKGTVVQSYTTLTPDVIKEAKEDVLTKYLNDNKFTHVLLMHLADIEKETNYVPGTTTGYYGGYGRYYGYGAGYYGSSGYYTTDKNYYVETTVYSVNPDKLLWTGTTKTINPSKVEKMVNEIADVVTDKMKKEGFLVVSK
jgi:hypothetical protein